MGSVTIDPTVPASTESQQLGPSRFKNIAGWLLGMFGQPSNAAFTFNSNPFNVDASGNVTVPQGLTVTGATTLSGDLTVSGAVAGASVIPGVAAAPVQLPAPQACPAGSFTALPFGITLATAALAKGFVRLFVYLEFGPNSATATEIQMQDGLGNTITMNGPHNATVVEGFSVSANFPAAAIAAQTITPIISVKPTGDSVLMAVRSNVSLEVVPSQ